MHYILIFCKLLRHDLKAEILGPASSEMPLTVYKQYVQSKNNTQAVQAVGNSQQLAAAVYQKCQPEPGTFRCPSCHRNSGPDISKIKKKCWNVESPLCLQDTVQVGYCSSTQLLCRIWLQRTQHLSTIILMRTQYGMTDKPSQTAKHVCTLDAFTM